LMGGAKLAGVLCESAARSDGRIEWLVIGLGANLAVAPGLPDRPTACLSGIAPSPESVACRTLHAVEAWRARLRAEGLGSLLAAWQRRGPEPGAPLTLRTGAGETTGRYRGLDADGALLLEAEGRVRRFATGELSTGGD